MPWGWIALWILLMLTIVGQWAGAPDTEGTVVAVVVVAPASARRASILRSPRPKWTPSV